MNNYFLSSPPPSFSLTLPSFSPSLSLLSPFLFALFPSLSHLHLPGAGIVYIYILSHSQRITTSNKENSLLLFPSLPPFLSSSSLPPSLPPSPPPPSHSLSFYLPSFLYIHFWKNDPQDISKVFLS